jgi:hypothetical protein
VQDMEIKDQEVVDLVNQLEDLDKKLCSHPLHKVSFCQLFFHPFALKIINVK